MKNVLLHTYPSFNQRRFSDWWVAKVKEDGSYDFNDRCGGITGRGKSGEAGDLYVFSPVEGQVYAYGQKDYRGNGSGIYHRVWQDGEFKICDKLGRVKDEV